MKTKSNPTVSHQLELVGVRVGLGFEKTAGAYYDKYKDFKYILAASVLFK